MPLTLKYNFLYLEYMSGKAQFDRPIRVKLDRLSREQLEQLRARSGLTKSELLRCAIRFAAPKFLSGEVPFVQVKPARRVKKGESQ